MPEALLPRLHSSLDVARRPSLITQKTLHLAYHRLAHGKERRVMNTLFVIAGFYRERRNCLDYLTMVCYVITDNRQDRQVYEAVGSQFTGLRISHSSYASSLARLHLSWADI